jgi:hypothetical protein
MTMFFLHEITRSITFLVAQPISTPYSFAALNMPRVIEHSLPSDTPFMSITLAQVRGLAHTHFLVDLSRAILNRLLQMLGSLLVTAEPAPNQNIF